MRDVAELAGVSKQTVSAVLNGKPGITAETQARIRQAVATLGYRLDNVASSLRTGRTRIIALVVSDISSPFIGRLAVAVGRHSGTACATGGGAVAGGSSGGGCATTAADKAATIPAHATWPHPTIARGPLHSEALPSQSRGLGNPSSLSFAVEKGGQRE